MIQSLLRAMELLELLKEANHKYSIAELSESTGLPPSTIHRILQTFCEKKYVIRDEHAHTYQLGPALISLGRAAADNVRIQDAALPILKNLSYCTREDSYLIIQVGDKGLVLDKTDGPNHLKVVEEFGYEMDLHCGAIRKALLAFQSDEYIRRYLDTRLNLRHFQRRIPQNWQKNSAPSVRRALPFPTANTSRMQSGSVLPFTVLTDAFPLRSESSHRIPVLKMTHIFCTCRIRSATVRQNYPIIWDIHLSRRNKGDFTL